MTDRDGDERELGAPVELDERARLVAQREEQLTATDWFFSHAVRMRAAYRPEQATPGDEPQGDTAPGDDPDDRA